MSYPLWTCDIDKSHAGQTMQQVMSYLKSHKTDYTPKIIKLSDFQKWFLDTGLQVTLLFRWDNYEIISPADDYTKKFLDLINNNSEFSMKPSAFVYYGDVDELLKTVSTDEEYLGLFLNDLVGKAKYNSRAVRSNINYYLSNILMGSNTALLTSISLTAGVIKMSKKKVIIQKLTGIELLSCIDVLCLDKTGTITDGFMEVIKLIKKDKNVNHEEILSNMIITPTNATDYAIIKKYGQKRRN